MEYISIRTVIILQQEQLGSVSLNVRFFFFLDVTSGKSSPALTFISCLFSELGAISAERYTSAKHQRHQMTNGC